MTVDLKVSTDKTVPLMREGIVITQSVYSVPSHSIAEAHEIMKDRCLLIWYQVVEIYVMASHLEEQVSLHTHVRLSQPAKMEGLNLDASISVATRLSSLHFLWFSSVSQDECWKSILKYIMTAFFFILSILLFNNHHGFQA
jgi:hypothetical protein